MRDFLISNITEELRSYFRAIVNEIKVLRNKVTVRGGNLQLTASVSRFYPGLAPKMVPTHVVNWCASAHMLVAIGVQVSLYALFIP